MVDAEFEEDPSCLWFTFVISDHMLTLSVRAGRAVLVSVDQDVLLDVPVEAMSREVLNWTIRFGCEIGQLKVMNVA